jgi:hypothetical protein
LKRRVEWFPAAWACRNELTTLRPCTGHIDIDNGCLLAAMTVMCLYTSQVTRLSFRVHDLLFG